ncbi:RNA 2'-phosphotransferase [Candidatus Poribacteria bacterium]|nr:MAG: RNA 2'-phosphotransferase [Candidatus Poribacteria bacterium]
MGVKGSYRRVSKLMALILRHKPGEFGVELDELGFCPLESLIRALKKRFPWVDERVVREIVEGDEKGRYEIKGDRIRARYGHSVPVVLDQRPVKPPRLLYHGTSRSALPSILKEGLRPMGRRFVHLSPSIEDALSVGRRHDPRPVILEVRAEEAWRSGIPFYRPSERVYLAPHIPPVFLRRNS